MVSWKRRPSPLVVSVVLVKSLGQLAQKRCDRMARERLEKQSRYRRGLAGEQPIGSSPAIQD
jgi:hypothetical protein